VIRERLEVVSYIHKGVKVTFENEAANGTKEVFQHEEGSPTTCGRSSRRSRRVKPVHEAPFTLERENGALDLVLQWTESTDEHVRSYVNGIPTGSGGTHENGLRAGIGKACATTSRRTTCRRRA
jgi:DNA gyrase/topoisomerase IV subunit B